MNQTNYFPLTGWEAENIVIKYFKHYADKTKLMEKPVAVFVAGQSGAGKTEAANLVKAELRKNGGYIHIDADRMRDRLPLNNQKFPSEVTQPDAAKLVGLLRTRTIAERRNFIEEGTFRDKEVAGKAVDTLKDNGYRVEMVAVATHSEQSLLGIYQRYEMQLAKGSEFPRLVPEDYHKIAFDGFTETIKTHADKFDRLRIVNREGNVLFDSAGGNNLKDAFTALTQGREMKAADLEVLKNGWNKVGEMATERGEKDEAYLTRLAVNRKRSESLYREALYKPNQHVQKNQAQHQSPTQVQTAKVKNRLR